METKKLVLDISKWRCGFNSIDKNNSIGVGDTALLNPNGFMCCLGQFALQLGLSEDDIFDKTEPEAIESPVELLTQIYIDHEQVEQIVNSEFSIQAIFINDNKDSTVYEKVNSLIALCSTVDIELEIKHEELILN